MTMMDTPAIPVVIVQAKQKPEFVAARIIVGIPGLFLGTWLVMLLMGAILPPLLGPVWALGYWQTMGLILLVRLILPRRTPALPRRIDIKEA